MLIMHALNVMWWEQPFTPMILHPKAKDPTHEKHRQIRIEGLSTKYLTSANTTQNNCEKQKKHKQLSQQRGAWEHDGKMCGVLG